MKIDWKVKMTIYVIGQLLAVIFVSSLILSGFISVMDSIKLIQNWFRNPLIITMFSITVMYGIGAFALICYLIEKSIFDVNFKEKFK